MTRPPLARLACSTLLTVAAACGPRATPATPSVAEVGNRPSAPTAPPAAPALGWTRATEITVQDSWAGLGCMHSFTAHLTRAGDRFVGDETLEAGGEPETQRVEVAASAIQALEDAAVRAAQVPAWDPPSEGEWTDDYPSGSITFTGPAGTARIFFEDQHRKLMLDRDGTIVPLRDPPPADDPDGAPGAMWTAYAAFLDGPLGLRPWIEARCGY